MLNLLLNGMDAMDDLEAASRRLVVRTQRLQDAIEVAVSDNGHGIPEECRGWTWAEDTSPGATFRWTLPLAPGH